MVAPGFKKTFGMLSACLVVVLLTVIALLAIFLIGIRFNWWPNPFLRETAAPVREYPAFIPPQITLTPDPSSNSAATVAAALPTPSLGNTDALGLAISSYMVSSEFDNREVGKFRSIGRAKYCQSLDYGNSLVGKGMQALFSAQIGSFYMVQTDLIGKIRTADLDPQLVAAEQKADPSKPKHIEIIPVDVTVEKDGRQLKAQKARIILTVDMGLGEPARMPGQVIPFTIDNTGGLQEYSIDSLARSYGHVDVLTAMRDHVNQLAQELAEWDGISPITVSGARTTFKLDRVVDAMYVSCNTPTPPQDMKDPSKRHCYDNLKPKFEELALANNFVGLDSFEVRINKPVSLDGYTTIEDGRPIVPQDVDNKFAAGSCSNIPDKAWILSLPPEFLARLNQDMLHAILEDPNFP